MARVVDVAAAWGGLAADLSKGALTRIAWQAPLAARLETEMDRLLARSSPLPSWARG